MSSPDRNLLPWRRARTGVRVAAAALIAVMASGCLRPLHGGPTASGAPMREILAAIEVEPVPAAAGQERLSHYLRSELVFDLDGSGEPRPKRFKLRIAAGEQVSSPIVDTVTGRAQSATLVGNALYTLTTLDGTLVTSGRATASASYDRYNQRFANVRAARDAEIRVAKLLSEQIRTRLSAAFGRTS